jgi:hypothetical protein
MEFLTNTLAEIAETTEAAEKDGLLRKDDHSRFVRMKIHFGST